MRAFITIFIFLISFPVFSQVPTNTDYDGKIIRNIDIDIEPIFEGDSLNWVYNKANELKANTKKRVIERELTLKEGQPLTPFLVQESVRNLNSLRFIRNIHIIPTAVNNLEIDVKVIVQQTWTLVPQVSFSSGDGRNKRSIGMADSDLFGQGKRLEVLFEDDDGKQSMQSVYDDRRLFGSDKQLILAYFDRRDGDIGFLSLDKPFRTLVDEESYGGNISFSDVAERLYRNGEERFVFRQDTLDLDIFYTFASGNPEIVANRYSFGYDHIDYKFSKATRQDFQDLGIKKSELDIEDIEIPDNRKFSGPFFAYQSIENEFIFMNYIDRFDRIEDYNLGQQVTLKLHYAPESLGSEEEAFLFSGTYGIGKSFSYRSFFRSEFGLGSRYQEGGFQNTIFRGDLRYYNVLGDVYIGKRHFGRHTFASALTFDYAQDLDRDQEFLLGADNFLRGYTAGTFTGDKRFVFNIEDRIHLIDDLWKFFSLGAVIFADVGASSYDNLGSMLQDQIYSDVGIGLRIGFPRSSGSRVLRIDVAFPLRDADDGTSKLDPRFLFSASQAFDSYLRSETVRSKKASIDTGF